MPVRQEKGITVYPVYHNEFKSFTDIIHQGNGGTGNETLVGSGAES